MTAQQLKNSILQMAVQGKLVPQDPSDEPASVLLDRIRAEKEQLVKQKKIKREKNPSYIFRGADNTPYEKIGENVHSLAEFAPFEIPLSWEWCRVGDLFTNTSGLAYKKESLNVKSERMVRVLRGGNIADGHYCLKSDDVFISSEFVKQELFLKKHYMITPAVSSLDHIGKIALIEENIPDTVVGGFVLMLIPLFEDEILSKYLLYAFSSKHHRDNCRSITHKSGQAFYNLSRELLMNLPVPVPPRHEMKRIIEKLENVLPHVDEYAVFEQESNTLNKVFPDMLKKSILQMAVQGKLVLQNPTDEPASVLLERIRAEKQRLVKEGKIKKDKHESVIFRRDNSHYEKLDGIERCIVDELPFDIPHNWQWIRLQQLCKSIADGDHQPPPQVPLGIPFLVISNVSSGYIDFSHTRHVPHSYFDALQWNRIPSKGDLLFTVTGSYGIVIPVDTSDQFCFQRHIALIKPILINADFLSLWLSSPLVYEQCRKKATGTAQKTVGLNTLRDLLIPLPPYQEQLRIADALHQILPHIQSITAR